MKGNRLGPSRTTSSLLKGRRVSAASGERERFGPHRAMTAASSRSSLHCGMVTKVAKIRLGRSERQSVRETRRQQRSCRSTTSDLKNVWSSNRLDCRRNNWNVSMSNRLDCHSNSFLGNLREHHVVVEKKRIV